MSAARAQHERVGVLEEPADVGHVVVPVDVAQLEQGEQVIGDAPRDPARTMPVVRLRRSRPPSRALDELLAHCRFPCRTTTLDEVSRPPSVAPDARHANRRGGPSIALRRGAFLALD